MSDLEEITAYQFTYTPWKPGPIQSVQVVIYAKTRKEAELIALGYNYKFFDQDLNVAVSEIGVGYVNKSTT